MRKSHLIGPGFRYLYANQPRLQRVTHTLEINSEFGWTLQSVKAGPRATATLSALLEEHPEAVAAVNGDFFSKEGLASGIQITGGRLVKNPATSWMAFGMDGDNRPFIDTLTCYGEIIINQFTSLLIDGFNRTRQSEEFILYNSFFGPATNTNEYGGEATLRLRHGHATVGDTVQAVVIAIDSTTGNNPITDSTLVLSGHGEKQVRYIRRMFVGQILEVAITSSRGRVKEAVGGFPVLVRAGANDIRPEFNKGEFYAEATARTAVGLSDSALYLVCVDKTPPATSAGMSLFDLAEFMISLGCTEALNLDGGGSSTMWLNHKIVNKPSEGEERKIANALMVLKP
ncbi:MAG: phosphodiester glycosidase family protein [Bacteroidetes bacterium]|nr:phosphodiester glycosidase family protein [Bacteroidota bacterium]